MGVIWNPLNGLRRRYIIDLYVNAIHAQPLTNINWEPISMLLLPHYICIYFSSLSFHAVCTCQTLCTGVRPQQNISDFISQRRPEEETERRNNQGLERIKEKLTQRMWMRGSGCCNINSKRGNYFFVKINFGLLGTTKLTQHITRKVIDGCHLP